MKILLLEGKVAVVTGGGHGVGKGHCERLVRNGASVVVNDIDQEAAGTVAADISSRGGKAIANFSNVGTREGCEALIAACHAAYGKIDILVNNAGIVRDKTLLKLEDADFDLVWRVHVMGTFWCTQAAARSMVKARRGGSIVNTTSGAHFGSFGQTNYAAAKGAIASMSYTWALELASKGIRVNAIAPLGTTQIAQTFKDAAHMPYFDPSANGAFVCWLCSDEAKFVSGQVFGTGGERIAHMVQPHYGKTMMREGGWDEDSISESFKNQMQGQFGSLGMLGKPYPFHGGIERPESVVE